ncbi:hypothetical protein SAMN02745172_03518 [Pseudoxanthobacter soli DSM 19599]|uniref:Oligosaccharide repeat unit polymerase n=1 Tax=Pseudoxanthobacter soli DSM 19599 TaxID=1123029 RepID=A0A1M7ZPN4_9HYPH|nr:hypothetical protein [Pseudoxanthobacter soli]SHO66858.1 hypothetical protein SAMN02745172_03518 [Pseudoxanthobacter soli DSM 19599]
MLFSMGVMILSLIVSIACWLRGRPKIWCFPSDFLFIGCVILVGLAPLANIYATTEYEIYPFSDDTVSNAMYGIAIMFTSFSFVWLFRKKLYVQHLVPREGAYNDRTLGVIAYSVIGATSVLLLVDPVSLAYKMSILKFISGGMSGSDYQLIRRGGYYTSAILSIQAYFRFSIIAFFFVLCATRIMLRFNIVIAAAILFLLYILCAASISKQPFFIFLAYVLIANRLSLSDGTMFSARRVIFILVAVLLIVTVLLTALYCAQYPEVYSLTFDGIYGALNLAIYRVYMAIYHTVLMYFEVYPNILPFSYFSDSSVVSALFGLQARDLALEVPTIFLGTDAAALTSFPTIFMASAYASIGFAGVALFSVAVALWVYVIDIIFTRIRHPQLRVAYYATMSVNMMFFTTQSALTAILTYGCGLIPILALLLDRFLVRRRARWSRDAQAFESGAISRRSDVPSGRKAH